jgi:hypothetical protein
MTIETILALIFGILDIALVYHWKERNRIRAKEEIWNTDTQSIVNIAAKMQEEIDKGIIKDAKQLKSGIMAIGAYANGIHVSIKKELNVID